MEIKGCCCYNKTKPCKYHRHLKKDFGRIWAPWLKTAIWELQIPILLLPSPGGA